MFPTWLLFPYTSQIVSEIILKYSVLSNFERRQHCNQ